MAPTPIIGRIDIGAMIAISIATGFGADTTCIVIIFGIRTTTEITGTVTNGAIKCRSGITTTSIGGDTTTRGGIGTSATTVGDMAIRVGVSGSASATTTGACASDTAIGIGRAGGTAIIGDFAGSAL